MSKPVSIIFNVAPASTTAINNFADYIQKKIDPLTELKFTIAPSARTEINKFATAVETSLTTALLNAIKTATSQIPASGGGGNGGGNNNGGSGGNGGNGNNSQGLSAAQLHIYKQLEHTRDRLVQIGMKEREVLNSNATAATNLRQQIAGIETILATPVSSGLADYLTPETYRIVSDEVTGLTDIISRLGLEERDIAGASTSLSERRAAAVDKYKLKLTELGTYYAKNRDAIAQNTALQSQYEAMLQRNAGTPSTIKDANARVAAINKLRTQTELYKATTIAAEREIATAREGTQAQLTALANVYQKHSAMISRNKNLALQYAEVFKRLQNPTKEMLTAEGLKATTAQVQSLITTTQTLEARFGRLGKMINSAIIGRFKHLAGMYTFTGIYRALRFMYTTIRDIDAEMTQLRIITQQNEAAYEKFANTAIKAARESSRSISEIIASSTVWARLGYSLNDSAELARVSGIFSNIANVTTDEATTSLTSVLKAYDYRAKDAEHIVDILTQVGQKYAISASELGTALEKGGAALATAGNTLEESVALMAAGNAAVQNAETVGTALKTTTLRLAGSKAELEEMGEEVDDLASSTSKMRKEILALSGVDIMLDADNYKSTYQILKEIAAVWDDISNVSQMTLLEDLAGKRNASVIASVINNIKDLEGAYKDAADSAGTAERANAEYLDSIAGRIGELEISAQALAQGFGTDGIVKGVVTVADYLLRILNTLNEIGLLVPMIIAVIGYTVLIKRNLADIAVQNSIIRQLAAVGPLNNETMQQYAMILGTVNKKLRERIMNEMQLSALQKSQLGGVISTGNVVTVGDLVGGMVSSGAAPNRRTARDMLGFNNTSLYTNNMVATPEQRNSAAELLEQTGAQTDANRELADSWRGVKEGAKDAGKGMKESFGSALTSAFSKIMMVITAATMLYKWLKSLIKTHDDYVEEANEASEALQKNKDKVSELNKELEELYETRRKLKALGSTASLQDIQDLDQTESRINEILKERQSLLREQVLLQQSADVTTLSAYGPAWAKLLEWLEDADTPAEKLKLLTEAFEAYDKAGWKYAQGATDQMQQNINAAIETASLMRDQALIESGVDGAYQSLIDHFVEYGKLSTDTIKKLVGGLDDASLNSTFKEVIELFEEWGVEIEDDDELVRLLRAYLNDAAKAAKEAADALAETEEKITNIDEAIKALKDPVTALRKAEQEMASTGYLTYDTYQKLIDLGLDEYIVKVANGYKLASNATKAYIEKRRDQIRAERDAAAAALKAAEAQIKAVVAVQAATTTGSGALKASGVSGFIGNLTGKEWDGSNAVAQVGQARQALKEWQSLFDEFERLWKTLERDTSSSPSSSNEDLFLAQWERVNEAMKHEVEMGKRTQESYIEWLRATTTRGAAGAYLNANEETYEKYKDKIKSVQEEIRKYDLEQLESQKDAFESLVDYRIKMLEEETKKQKEELDKRKEALEDFYDKQIEMLEDQFDEEDYLEEQAKKRKELADMQRQMDMLERDDSAWAKKRLAELKEEYHDAEEDYRKWERDHARDAVKQTLEDERDASIKTIEDAQDALEKTLEDSAALRRRAVEDILNGNEDVMRAMEQFSIEQGEWLDQNITGKWDLAREAVQKYGGALAALKALIGVDAENNETYRFFADIFSGEYKKHAAGTSNASAGWAITQENGFEAIMRKSGGMFTLLGAGDKVFNASATDFLYAFANNPMDILASSMSRMLSHSSLSPALAGSSGSSTTNIDMGDVIIQGNADEKTVSEIRRAQRAQMNGLLREFKKLRGF